MVDEFRTLLGMLGRSNLEARVRFGHSCNEVYLFIQGKNRNGMAANQQKAHAQYMTQAEKPRGVEKGG